MSFQSSLKDYEIRYESKWRSGYYLTFFHNKDNLEKLKKYRYNIQIKEKGSWISLDDTFNPLSKLNQ